MKRLISADLLIMTVVMLGACSSETDGAQRLSKEGIAPYELSESENISCGLSAWKAHRRL